MKSSLITKLIAATPALAACVVMAGVTPNLLDSQGQPVRDGSGACVRSEFSVEHPDCVAKKAEPAKPAAPRSTGSAGSARCTGSTRCSRIGCRCTNIGQSLDYHPGGSLV